MTKLLQTLLLGAALATLSGCGKQPATPAPAAAPGTTAQAPAPAAGDTAATATLANGESTFKKACALCHQTGTGGAPKPGDKEDWAPRIAQGMATLHEHSIKGFTGAKGLMPAKGGNPMLTDDDVMAAVDYMVAQSQ
ncbi:MAG: c-type cytochrome [Gammaproteobacteria bacterium]|nr:c-type cytochrome [Gammaproteobacteria bacterium]